ncbi:DUF2269 family protein [Gryllotalpicola sp.]|uniref:DUF2269 family protein n=1 Tax=Gryllotalpicola sp. TaxID=1932787 RepID=UPI0026143F12|nr:DUF2269 family protein [Gryllotalpicola sp.]
MFTLLVTLHVLFAVFVIGPLAVIPHLSLRFARNRQADQVRSIATLTTVFSWASVIVFVLGFGALSFDTESGVGFGQLWVWLSIVLYLAAFALAFFVVVPSMKTAATEIEANPEGTGKPTGYGALTATAGVVSVLLLAIVVLMALRP